MFWTQFPGGIFLCHFAGNSIWYKGEWALQTWVLFGQAQPVFLMVYNHMFLDGIPIQIVILLAYLRNVRISTTEHSWYLLRLYVTSRNFGRQHLNLASSFNSWIALHLIILQLVNKCVYQRRREFGMQDKKRSREGHTMSLECFGTYIIHITALKLVVIFFRMYFSHHIAFRAVLSMIYIPLFFFTWR